MTEIIEIKTNDSQAMTGDAVRMVKGNQFRLPEEELEDIMEELDGILESLLQFSPKTSLSDSGRRSLRGSGVRRYGFIDKVSDLAGGNPEFTPPFLSIERLKEILRQIEVLRNISAKLQQMVRINTDNLLITGDAGYRLALMYYSSVRDASKKRVPGAEAVFRALQMFFRRSRRMGDEPTEAEVERDVKALLHRKKSGKIIIENEKPRLSGGKHLVVDNV